MWALIAVAVAGNLPRMLDKGASRWLDGDPPHEAFRVLKARQRPSTLDAVRREGIDALEFVAMELELVFATPEPTRLRLLVDPRRPARPLMYRAQIRPDAGDRSTPIANLERMSPELARLAIKTVDMLLEARCPSNWRRPQLRDDLPGPVRADLEGGIRDAFAIAEQACQLAIDAPLQGVYVDDVSWLATSKGAPVGVFRGELSARRDGMHLELGSIRRFPK